MRKSWRFWRNEAGTAIYQKVSDTHEIKIEKNTVQETLIIPLYARKVCSELYPNLYRDETAVRLINEIDYDFSEAEKNSRGLMQRFGSLEVAMRQNDLAFEVRDYLKSHPNAAVVNLGCELVQQMADAFPGSVLVFDAANRTAVKMIAKTWLKSAKIQDVGAYFAVSDAPQEIGAWDSRLQITSRGYMLGYNDLKDPSVSGFFRFLARVGDGVMKMQIVRIKFGGR